uniref:Cytochrome P450 736A295 n=1 Tax=Leucophyllum frutescens TaxID=86643 RepID=A0A7G6J4K8_LEUFR|nr:cytochrome P450 736A295 [Leucophyllum frutescens]
MAWVWTAVAAVAAVLYLLQQLLSLKNKKKLPPGPKGIPILGHFHLMGKNPHQDFYHLARKHGGIMYMRFGFIPTVIVSSPGAAELFLKTHDLVFASKPPNQAAKYISYDQRGIVIGPYSPYWRQMRKLITLEMLSNLRINQFQPMRKAELGKMISSIKQAAQEGQTVDLSSRVSGLSADMTCLMVFGRKYSDGDLDEKGFKDVIADTLAIAAAFSLVDYFPFLERLDLQGITQRMKELSKIFDGFLEKIIEDHVLNKNENKQTHDFVDTMMAIMESGEAGFEFDRRNIKAVLLDMLIAGLDTSATAVEWALSELIKRPEAMQRLKEELQEVVGMDKMVDESHLEHLRYLDFVIREALRLHPVVPMLTRFSMEDCTLDGFHIPKDTRVLVNVWAIGRDPEYWPEPEKFMPERYFDRKVDLKGRDFQLIPFGSGRRSCPGMQLGLTSVRMVLAQLVHCFDWTLPDGVPPTELDMTEKFGLVTARANHLEALPTYRLHK